MIKYFIIIFLTDLIIRVFVNPKFSPSLIIGRLIVSRQVPEYVGAAQKKFAWKIGIVLAALMFFLLVVVNSYSIITGLTCLICLVFLFFESAFGICLGCLFYGLFYKKEAQYCAGEICDVRKKQDIQKISRVQILIIFGFIVYVVLTILFFNDLFSKNPKNLWQIINSGLSK
jgi:ABC-type transport system involved in multi-copper enzyme maturation permease subunit